MNGIYNIKRLNIFYGPTRTLEMKEIDYSSSLVDLRVPEM